MEKMQYIVDLLTNVVHKVSAQAETVSFQGEKLGQSLFIIDLIARKPDCTMKDIVNTLALTPSTATRHVDKLVEMGLVDRNLSIFDRRSVILFLTQKGVELDKQFLKHRLATFSSILESFSVKEQDIIIRLMQQIIDQI
jgi:DNA-binding MarR family transcriptional regulator